MIEVLDILSYNNINIEELNTALHKDILEMYLKEICEYMKSSEDNYIKIKKIYIRYKNDIDAIRTVVGIVGNLRFPEEDLRWLNKCILCFFKKKMVRKNISDNQKMNLWNNQNRLCQRCKKHLLFNDIRVDHIIPWDYVGDELPDNYQILCSKCNGEKSNHVAETIHNLIFNKEV